MNNDFIRDSMVASDMTLKATGLTPKNRYNMRSVIFRDLCNWYSAQKTPSRSLSNSLQKHKSTLAARPNEALDLVRGVFQKSLNLEIDAVIQKFMRQYLACAIKNIQNNDVAVVNDHIYFVYHRILDEAKRMYPITKANQDMKSSEFLLKSAHVNAPPAPSYVQQPQPKPVNRHITAGLRKRREVESDVESDASQASGNYIPRKKVKTEVRPTATVTYRRPPTTSHTTTTTTTTKTFDVPLNDIELDAVLTKINPIVSDEPSSWNPDRINEQTLFVLGSKANSALGLSAQRGRIYIKHPGLFRYVGDQEDKMWLFENKQKTVKIGGKAFLVVLGDIFKLAELPDYKNNPEVQLSDLAGFALPPFMLDKMKSQMTSVYNQLRAKYRHNLPPSTVAAPHVEAPVQQSTERANESSLFVNSGPNFIPSANNPNFGL